MTKHWKRAASLAAACIAGVIGSTGVLAANWTQAGYDAQHTGYDTSETTIAPWNVRQLHTAFNVNVSLSSFPQSIVANGLVFVSDGGVEAIQAKTGVVKWTAKTCDGEATSFVPAYVHGRVWVGLNDGGYEAFDASSGQPFVCRPGLRNNFAVAPSASHETVYFAGTTGELIAVSAATGELRWATFLSHSGEWLDSPAVSSDGRSLFVGTEAGNVYKVNASTGATIWKTAIDSVSVEGVTVSGDRLFVGGFHNLYAVSAQTGSLIWKTHVFEVFVTPPAVAAGLVIAGDQDPRYGLSAFDVTTGRTVWFRRAPVGEVFASVTVANGVVYLVSDATHLLDAFSLVSGRILAAIAAPANCEFIDSPVTVVNAMVYAAASCSSNTSTSLVGLTL